MEKPVKISGYVLKFGEEIEPGVKIAKDCKVTLPKNIIIVQDDQGIKYEGEVNMFELATGGVVKKREGNIIQEFDIKEVSIIPKVKK